MNPIIGLWTIWDERLFPFIVVRTNTILLFARHLSFVSYIAPRGPSLATRVLPPPLL